MCLKYADDNSWYVLIILRQFRPCLKQGDISIETEALSPRQVVVLIRVVWLAEIVFAWQNGV